MKHYLSKLLILSLLCVGVVGAQNAKRNNRVFVRDSDAALSSAALDVTVQQPASGSKWVFFEVAEVYCSVACVVTISRDGTAASATAATEVSVNGGYTPAATAFIDSDAGAGTTLNVINVSAGSTITVDLDGLFLEPNDTTTNNLTVQTDAISGSASIFIRWREE